MSKGVWEACKSVDPMMTLDPTELKLQTLVSHHVGARNQTQVLWSSDRPLLVSSGTAQMC